MSRLLGAARACVEWELTAVGGVAAFCLYQTEKFLITEQEDLGGICVPVFSVEPPVISESMPLRLFAYPDTAELKHASLIISDRGPGHQPSQDVSLSASAIYPTDPS